MKPRSLTRAEMLARAAARDAGFDGVFLTCVRTTGIYCLPSCRARSPKPENVEHAASPDEARQRGFRPCLRCRPDDHYAGRDGDRERLLLAIAAVRARPAEFTSIGAFAAAAECGATKLLQLCRQHLHRAPAEVLLQLRLERARELLASTRSRVLDIGLDSGFAGSSAFHDNFRARFGTTPRGYRTLLAGDSFALRLPAGHPIAACLRYQLREPSPTMARGDDRTLQLPIVRNGRAAMLTFVVHRTTLRARVEPADGRSPGAELMAAAHSCAVRLLRLDCDPAAAVRALRADAALRPMLRRIPGLRPWPMPDAFDCLCLGILGQQVHTALAHQLRAALAQRCGTRIGELWAPPSPAAVAALDNADLRRLRLTRSKGATLVAAARTLHRGELDLDDLARGSAVVAATRLQELHGIGPWTAQYVLLRGLGFLDCLPSGDSALATAAQSIWNLDSRPSADDLARRAAAFAPHRSVLTFHLWRTFADAKSKATTSPHPVAAPRAISAAPR